MDREERRVELRKHADHNQKDHGNWARSGFLRANLKVHGGFTIDTKTGFVPTIGYMVSYPGQVVIPATTIKDSDITKFRKLNEPRLNTKNAFLGAWIDGETGLAYLDVSQRFMDQVEAHKFGVKNDQIAMYNLETGEEIRIRPITPNPRPAHLTKSGKRFTYVSLEGLTDAEAARAIQRAAG